MAADKTTIKKRPLVLIIDDEEAICQSLAGVFSDEGWGTVTALNGRDGMIEFKLQKPDLVFLDVWMPGIDGIETLQHFKEMDSAVPVVIMSGHGTIETAVRATKLGAYDFIEKPMSIGKILPLAEQVARHLVEKRSGSRDVPKCPEMIGDPKSLLPIQKQLKAVGPRNALVLITGENGTGKEVLAMNIHALSSRAGGPFIAVNCAAIPEDLIESELFGHEKGAFTGAVSARRGRFELASGGTLFLDEIGDMSLRTQAKMLRVLQEHTFERVGGEQTLKTDVRVIAATNKDLPHEVAQGDFREDLFYRLNVVPFHLLPLRQRPNDLEPLMHHFFDAMAVELKEPVKSLGPGVLGVLKKHGWPGNIRELRNLIERLCIMVPGGEIQVEDLPETFLEKSAYQADGVKADATSLKEAKSDWERAYILDKLQENQWNVSKTADAIGIERSNLHRKLKSYNIDTKQLKD